MQVPAAQLSEDEVKNNPGDNKPSSFILHPSSFPHPSSLASSIVSARPAKNPVDPFLPYAFVAEPERTSDGRVEQVATVFLTNRECPFRCLFCDLWKNTTDARVPVGAIPAQIDYALARLPAARHIKLYNSGNFFDPQAIPPEDFGEIARRVRGFRTVIVENHPRLCGESCLRFRDAVGSVCRTEPGDTAANASTVREKFTSQQQIEPTPDPARQAGSTSRGECPQLEVALGLETIHPATLARLNKQMTVDDFDRAVEFLLKNNIPVRAFILLRPPGQSEEQGIEWALRSIEHARSRGVRCCSVIPVRGGNGIMEQLAASGDFAPPRLPSLERVLETSLHSSFGNPHSAFPFPRVFVDLWDAARFTTCPHCVDRRIARLHAMNLSQTVLPAVECACRYEAEPPSG